MGTSLEMNNKAFEVQRSYDNRSWTIIAEVAGAGTTSASHTYSFTDQNISSTIVYYRIHQVDMDGNFTFSAEKVVHMDKSDAAAKVYAYGKMLLLN